MPAVIDVSDSDASAVIVIPRPSGSIRERLLALARTPAVDETDPNRRFNPDILLTIAEMLAEARDYKTLISLSRTSRYLNHGTLQFLRHLRKRVILKLDDMKLKRQQGWGSVKYIECNRSSPYPIDRALSTAEQNEQKQIIRSKLKPSVIRFMGEPHESAFRLQSELFPSVKVIRFLHNALAQNLDCVLESTSVKVGESSLELINRMVPHVRHDHYNYHAQRAAAALKPKVIEYQKKGFEFRDLNLLSPRQIQSSIQVKASGGLELYMEDWARYELHNGDLQHSLAYAYMESHINVLDRTDLEEIFINVYLKPTPDSERALISSDFTWNANLNKISDKVEEIAKNHLSKTANVLSTIKFRLHFIHGDSKRTTPPIIRRPAYSSHEKQEHISTGDLAVQAGRLDDEEDGDSQHGSDSDGEDRASEASERSQAPPKEQEPVFSLTFTKSGSKVRTTESIIDKDVLRCSMNGGCSRCRTEG